jgi:Ohr subfamily peroxiredoxin
MFAVLNRKTLYTARVRTDGDRNGGISRSDDGRIDLTHTFPGTPGNGTNSEQLLAAGWSACFQGAMSVVAQQMKVKFPQGTAIDAEIDLCHGDDGYSLQARLDVSVPGMSREVAETIVKSAHEICPYSKALSGNIPVTVRLV